LYELVRDRQAPRAPREQTPPGRGAPPPPPPDEEPTPLSWFSPGRTVRVPVGYFLFGLALIAGVFVAGWAIGHEQAESAWERERAALYAADGAPTRDPLLTNAPFNPALVEGRATGGATAQPAPGPDDREAGAPEPATDPVSTRDPRQAGMNYLLVARFGQENAEKAAAFLRARGVEAAALPRNNERLVPVFALRGFAPGEVGGEEARAFRDQIVRLGRRWKSERDGGMDFDGAYFEKHQP